VSETVKRASGLAGIEAAIVPFLSTITFEPGYAMPSNETVGVGIPG
jgi:hypothetical protein